MVCLSGTKYVPIMIALLVWIPLCHIPDFPLDFTQLLGHMVAGSPLDAY